MKDRFRVPIRTRNTERKPGRIRGTDGNIVQEAFSSASQQIERNHYPITETGRVMDV